MKKFFIIILIIAGIGFILFYPFITIERNINVVCITAPCESPLVSKYKTSIAERIVFRFVMKGNCGIAGCPWDNPELEPPATVSY